MTGLVTILSGGDLVQRFLYLQIGEALDRTVKAKALDLFRTPKAGIRGRVCVAPPKGTIGKMHPHLWLKSFRIYLNVPLTLLCHSQQEAQNFQVIS